MFVKKLLAIIEKLLLRVLAILGREPDVAFVFGVGPLFSTPFAEFIATACELLTFDGIDSKRPYPVLPPPTLPCVNHL